MKSNYSLNKDLQDAVHPKEVIPGECIFSSKTLGLEGIIVESHMEPPGEYETPPLTANLIILSLEGTNRQVSKYGGKYFEGKTNKGYLQIIPANHEGFFSWDTYERSIEIILEQDHLSKLSSENFNLNPDTVELIPNPDIYDTHIEKIALLIKDELETNEIGSKIYLESLANALILQLLKNYSSDKPIVKEYKGGLSKNKLRKVIEYINSNLEKTLTLTEIADIAKMSQYHFARLFKQSTGMSPHKYIILRRVKVAKEMLAKTNDSIAEIAYKLGFSSQSHLNRYFRSIVNTTPKKYRESL